MRFSFGIGMSLILITGCSDPAIKLHVLDSSPGCFPAALEDGTRVSVSADAALPILFSAQVNTASVTEELLQNIRESTASSLKHQITRASRLTDLIRENPVLPEWDKTISISQENFNIEARSTIREEDWGLLYSSVTSTSDKPSAVNDFVEVRYTAEDTLFEFTDSSFRIGNDFVETSSLIRGCSPGEEVYFEVNQVEVDGVPIELTLCWVPSVNVTSAHGNQLTPDEYVLAAQLECNSAIDKVLGN